jgi:hypothetical protein
MDPRNTKLTDLAMGPAYSLSEAARGTSSSLSRYLLLSDLYCPYKKRERFLQQKPDSWDHGICVL